MLRTSKELKNQKEKYHLAASFQKTINEILYEKTKVAMEEFVKNKKSTKNIQRFEKRKRKISFSCIFSKNH